MSGPQRKWEPHQLLPVVLSIIALFMSLAVSIKQCSLEERRMKLHLEPDLICVLDDHPEKEHFLLFTIKNEGLVEAINVSVDHVSLRYSKKEKKIRFGGASGGRVLEYNPPGKRWIFIHRLAPNTRAHKLTGEWASRDSSVAVDVLIFDISYYRETDGKRYEKRRIYYVDGKDIFTPSQFRTNPHQNDVDSEVSRTLQDEKFFGWWPDKEKKQ
jgi:hypothetical protein